MRFALNLLWLSLVSGATIRSPAASSYDGSRVYRVKAGRQLASVHKRLAGIASDTWDQAHGNLDVVIPRDQIESFEGLGLSTRMLHSDLGESIAKESVVKRSDWKRQANDSKDPWFDSYHPYADVRKTTSCSRYTADFHLFTACTVVARIARLLCKPVELDYFRKVF
jgi:hypothetical protein